jgi:hypothetical protein
MRGPRLHPRTKLIPEFRKHPAVLHPTLLKQKGGTNHDAAFPYISRFSSPEGRLKPNPGVPVSQQLR